MKALITGGSSGIGFAFAKKLLREGYHVVLLSRDEQNLARAVSSLKTLGLTNVSATMADVRDQASLQAAFQGIGPVDLLVHSAGILKMCHDTDSPMVVAHKLDACLETNTVGTAQVISGALAYLRPGSQIAVLCSVAGLVMFPGGYEAYGTSKAAQRIWCESIRGRLLRRGIRLTMVYPSIVKTPMATNLEQAPPICRLVPWRDPDAVVETFYRDIMNGRRESYVNVSERLLAIAARIAPRTFKAIVEIGVRWLAE